MENRKLTWPQLFSEIVWGYDKDYIPYLRTYSNGITAATFHKLTIYSDGRLEYKGDWSFFEPTDFWKVKLIVQLFEKGALDVLYGK